VAPPSRKISALGDDVGLTPSAHLALAKQRDSLAQEVRKIECQFLAWHRQGAAKALTAWALLATDEVYKATQVFWVKGGTNGARHRRDEVQGHKWMMDRKGPGGTPRGAIWAS